MACQTFKTQLKGIEYTYTQLPASQSILLKLKIAKIFGDAIPELIGALGQSDNEQLRILSNVITTLLNKNKPEEITDLLVNIISTIQIGMERIKPDSQFSGDLSGFYSLVFWTLKKEYGDFLEGMTATFGLKKPAAVKIVG